MGEATTPADRLREGLSRARSAANDATMASALIRPDKPAERVKEALTRVREGLNAATEAVGDALRSGDRGDGMDRRGLLRALSAAAATAVLPPGSLDHLTEVAQAVGTGRRVDAGLLTRLEGVTSSLAQAYRDTRPEELTGPVRGLADQLVRQLDDQAMLPGQRARLGSLAADVHLFAGWLALDSDLRADARAYFRQARDLAREAHDGVLYAQALNADGLLYALRTPDNRRGDPARAAYQIGQAYMGLPDDAPPAVRATLAVSDARHRALVGDRYGFQAGMVRAAEALERHKAGQGAPARGFMSVDGGLWSVEHDGWLTDYEGRGLAALRRPTAADVLCAALDAEAGPRRRSAMLISLASVRLDQDPEEAAALAIESFDLALRSGYAVAYPALDSLRAKLPADVVGTDALHERLASV
jgi:hypothetical protein